MEDIADDLGVSVVTVSKVLRNHPDIAEGTRRRVLKSMRELNYQPNFAARALVTGRTYTIGLVVPNLLHPFFAEIAKAISLEARNHGYSLFISSSDEDPELEEQEIKQLLARRVDVILIASAQWSIECFRMIEENKTPYVLIDRRFQGLNANFVGVDDEAVGMIGTSHLIEQGCKCIAHIRGPEVSTGVGRLEGYKVHWLPITWHLCQDTSCRLAPRVITEAKKAATMQPSRSLPPGQNPTVSSVSTILRR